MRALGAYIFAGGFTEGVRQRFDVMAHFEGSDYGVATARLNFPKLPIHYPIEKWPVDDPSFKEVDFIYGNPPCAAWSVAGYTKSKGTDKWRTDPRVECTVAHFGLLRKLRPKVWAWESVTQAYSKGIEFVKKLEEEALSLGYSVTYLLHDAQWLGLPQVRRRFFMVCHRVELNVAFPNWAPPQTCWDVLKHVKPASVEHRPKLGDQFDDKLHLVKPGERLSAAWERILRPAGAPVLNARGQVKNRPSFGHCRLDPEKTANAVVGYMMIHPTENRWMTVNELQALSGFPQDWKWAPKKPGDIASEMARGVCPNVGAWLAMTVAEACENGKPVEEPTVTEVNVMKPPGSRVRLDPSRLVATAPASVATSAGSETHRAQADPDTPAEAGQEEVPAEEERSPSHLDASDLSDYIRGPTNGAELKDHMTKMLRSGAITAVALGMIAIEAITAAKEDKHGGELVNGEGRGGNRAEARPVRERWEVGGRADGGPGQQVLPGDRPDVGQAPQERSPDEARTAAAVGPAGTGTVAKQRSSTAAVNGEGSGAFIRRLLMADRHTPEEIVAAVLATFENRKTTVRDVYWNWNRLKETNQNPPPWRGSKVPGAYPGTRAEGEPKATAPAQGEPARVPAARSIEAAARVSAPRVKTALITGSTAMQIGSDKTHLKIVTAMASWREALKALGYEVEWRAVTPGEDLRRYHLVLAGINKPNVRTSTYFYGVLWAMSTRPDAIVVYDDWQTTDVLAGIQSFARERERAFRLERAFPEAVKAHEAPLFRALEFLAGVKQRPDSAFNWWPWQAIVPAFSGGNLSLLGIPAKAVTGIDPTAFSHRYPATPVKAKEKAWVQASLLAKGKPKGLAWPLRLYGNLDKEGGDRGRPGENAQERLLEEDLMKVYCECWGVISPPHKHAGSGWWRVRYLMAADAGCVLSADPKEAYVMGMPYVEASHPAVVEKLRPAALTDLAKEQAARLRALCMSKEEVLTRLRKVITDAGATPP
jgi:site-specific DNA-cytosine methylase